MSNDNDQRPKKPTKLERERAMYAKMGMKHPKDMAVDVAMANLRGWTRKIVPPPNSGNQNQ